KECNYDMKLYVKEKKIGAKRKYNKGHKVEGVWVIGGYNNLKKIGYKHKTVNHKKYFKDPETNVHTNTIEESFNVEKLHILKEEEITLYQEKINNNCSKNNNIIEYNIDGNESEFDELVTSSDETGCEDISDKKHLLVYVKLVGKINN
ncbi:uncharacterized protein B0P05DRAFT_448479, partial [Gilbertella persicaria]|uniref:uncharacterized protein n=1 Tax=Gilbertella persicaria TaxID=101096 RepID=UPI00221F4626